ncbi:SRPBCC domain-containing protein [Kribbella italica]|uniref:Uncharacterized protein YndB with AHSA1/START domain n=1 Tax=Kribbella italica TaxID=1540520 RepID=A0A7W9MWB1_9ACTN|nr:uncharacterized protein YndB with AHSA1/START domain [Kribbella italica]
MTYQLHRTFTATPAQLFRFFTEPTPFSQWFVVPGFRTEQVHINAHPGGTAQAVMVAEDGSTEIPFTVGYGAVEPPRRVVLHPSANEEVTITLADAPDGTVLTYAYAGPATSPADRSAVEAMLDQIARHTT